MMLCHEQVDSGKLTFFLCLCARETSLLLLAATPIQRSERPDLTESRRKAGFCDRYLDLLPPWFAPPRTGLSFQKRKGRCEGQPESRPCPPLGLVTVLDPAGSGRWARPKGESAVLEGGLLAGTARADGRKEGKDGWRAGTYKHHRRTGPSD